MNSKAPGAAASMTPTATADPAVRSEHAFEARIHSDSRASTPEIEEALGRPAPGSPTSESYIDEPHSAELYTYLREAPRNYNYLLTPAARKSILRRVSWYLLSRDDRLADLVPLDERTGGAPREELQDEVEVPIEYTEVRRGQPCGHVFKRGEGVYRCNINSGTGGCCDCGDPEAWKIPLRCRHHSSFEELEECGMEPIVSSAGAPFVPGYKTNNNGCPASVRRSIGLTIAVVLEFILESFATSPINLTAQFDEHTIIEDAHNAGLAIGDHEKQEQFAIVLWNDEVHSYQDVIDQCTEALQCSQIEAKRIAKAVDTCGRDVLRVSASIPELIDIATTMTNVSLSVSIRAARDIFREQLSASLLIWLRDLACCKFRPLARVFSGKINNEIRSEISYQLCLRWVAPYRNPYLADILERMYDYNLLESEFGDEDDAMEEDDQEYYEDDDEGYRHVGDQEMGSVDAAYNTTMPVAQPNANQAHSMYAYPIDSSGDAAAYRGLRRRRSESEDSLQHEGEERASPRGFMQGRSEDNDDIPPSMWLAENNTPSTIHAAMGAAAGAVDAARLSLARIMQPDPTANYPPHSAAPGAYPNSAVLTESESEVPVQEAVHSASATQLVQDPVLAQDMQTAQSIERVLRGCGQQRLDWFLIFDLQLWKEVRSGLRELYMATLMLDSRYKMKIALTFARNYPRLSRAFLTQDRAPEHSVLLFSVQLFTAPTLSASLVEHHYFLYIILDVLKKFFMDPTPEFLRHCGVTLCDTGSFRNRRYFHVFHDMRYLAGTPQVRNWVSIHHRFLASYVGFIGLFQGMNPNCRAILQHVEFEADTWVNAFNVTLQVAKSCRQFAECYGISARDLFFAIRGTLRTIRRSVMLMAEENSAPIIRSGQVHGYLPQAIANPVNSGGEIGDAPQLTFETHVLQTLWGRQYEVVKYDVSSCPVSFHHPLHWFMAEMFQHVKHLTDERARDFGFASIRDMVFSAFDTQLDTALEVFAETTADSSSVSALHTVGGNDMAAAQLELLRILDYPIRVCVVMAQIRAGLWVRNGYVIRLQSHHYREVSLRENTYDQDIVMIQFFLSIWPDTDHILMTLLDRFELYDWFSGRIQQSQVYEPFHLQYMVEEFLNLLIVIMSERHVATGKNALDLARREIVHGCLSPISYSELSKKVPERLAENTEFDNLLQKMADYRGPTGIMDFGQYELKDEFLDEVDPYFIHYSHNQREEVEEVLRERLKKRMRKQGSTEDVPEYLPPKLEPIRFGPFQRIGMLLHTPLACQVLFHALLHATQTPAGLLSETMVDEALQLIVLALEDGQRGAVAREIGGIDIGNASSEQAASGTAVDRGGLWKYALEQGYPAGRGTPMNLLGLVLTLGLKPEMKQWKHKLDHIYHLFRQGGPRIVSCIDDYYANLEATPMGSRVLNSAIEETKAAERKKEAAKARQAAIMAEFANQQQQFMSQFGDEFDDLSDDEDDAVVNPEATVASADGKGKSAETTRVHRPLWGAPTGACIVCQEECDSLRPYGMLGIIQANRLVRTAPLADASQVVDILRLPGGLDMRTSEPNSAMQQGHSGMLGALPVKGISHSQTAEQLQTLNFISAGAYGANSGLKKFPVTYHKRGMAASTCGHMMHVKCFTQYCQGIELKRRPHPTRNHPENLHRKEFLCPLCKSLGNVLLPALPGVADYDPLSTIDSERFTIESPAKKAELFEHWLENEWKPFGEALSLACSKQSDSSSSASSSSVDSAASNTPADNTTASGDTQTSTGSHQHVLQLSSADSGAAAQHPSTFPFNFAEGLTDSIPRLDEFIRNAPLMTGGLGLQTLISRLLPQLTGSNMVAAQGPERLALPLSRYVRWLVERQALDAGHHHHRRHFNSRPSGGGDDSSRVSTPDTSAVPSAGAAFAEHHSSSEVEARYREQMEGFHCMYSRLYDVLQNVQRDNHVGLPAPSLFEHLSRSKDKGSTSASPAHGQQDSEPAAQEEAMADKSDPSEEIEDEDFMACTTPAGATETTGSNRFMYEPSPTALPPFLQNFLDQIRGFGAVNGPQPISAAPTNNNGASGQPQHGKGRLYPFDRAAAELFTYTIELLELSQRGARNPPVFNHEDSRTLPSGTLTDAVPETLATFLHLLGKIPELHYRIMFDTSLQVASAEEKSSTPARPPERLRALIKESRLQANSATAAAAAAATASDSATVGVTNETIARTRLDMLQDIANTLAPLIKPVFARSCEFVNELSQWHLGGEVAITRPFLMQDMYALLSELSLSLVGPFGLDIWHLTRLLLTAELVRICVAVGDSVLGEYSGAPKALRIAHSLPLGAESYHSDSPCISQQSGRVPQPWVDAPEARDVSQLSSQSDEGDTAMLESSAPSIHALVMWAIRQVQGSDLDSGALERLKRSAHPVTVTKLVATLLLPFLRQVALMFNIQHGLDIAREAPWLSAERHRALGNDSSITQVLSQDIPECTRLLKLLNLPDLPQLFDPETQPGTLEFVEGWLRDLRVFRRRHASPMSLGAGYTMAVPVNMPTPYSLVELPERFEVLFERSAKAFCPRCNGVPSEPALCLLCGNFVCVQSFCCQEDGIGECNMHMKTCGGTIGVFLQVKKCGLVLLHHDNGCFMSAPYLDQHGEVDLGLKRGRPLFLAHDRYEEMRRLVLTQKIPIFIARKIEQSFDIGGWVSL
ncbi:E3 ubiquitin-protein ligase ubr1 [Coemansia sp. RSA 990]|nr:E3 ubiquitin-protein ligase ubr1 [Coemansia sp. RSA 990]